MGKTLARQSNKCNRCSINIDHNKDVLQTNMCQMYPISGKIDPYNIVPDFFVCLCTCTRLLTKESNDIGKVDRGGVTLCAQCARAHQVFG